MANYLAIDWDHHQLHVVAARTSGSSIRIQKAVLWKESQDPNPAEAEALGKVLRDRLKEAGIAPAPVLICVGRDRVILKEIRHPEVPATEEPALVRFQALKELTNAADEVVIDYQPRGRDGRAGERRAQVVILRRELLNTYKALCKGAGLKLVGITPRSFGTVACLNRVMGTTVLTPAPEPRDAAVAILFVGEEAAEFCVVRNGELQLSRAMNAPVAGDAALLGEIRRNLAVYSGQAPQHAVRALYVAGNGEHGGLRQRLQDVLAVPVHTLDPFGGQEQPGIPTGNRGSFTGAVGLLHAKAEAAGLPINFVKPREPVQVSNPHTKQFGVGLAAAGIVAAVIIGLCTIYLSSVKKEVGVLDYQLKALDKELAEADKDNQRHKHIETWVSSNVVWSDEFYDLTHRFVEVEEKVNEKDKKTKKDITSEVRLTQVTGDILAASPTDKSKKPEDRTALVGRMSIKGVITRDSQPVDMLIDLLSADGHYHPTAKQMSRNSGGQSNQFSQQFSTSTTIKRRNPDEYTLKLSFAPPERRREEPTKPGRNEKPGRGGKPGGRNEEPIDPAEAEAIIRGDQE